MIGLKKNLEALKKGQEVFLPGYKQRGNIGSTLSGLRPREFTTRGGKEGKKVGLYVKRTA